MKALQKLVADDGYEVMLFPLQYLYISQDEGGSYSHSATLNVDFLGRNQYGTVANCPFYAPCTMVCVDIWDYASNTRIYESLNKVHCADGTLRYITIQFTHDDRPLYTIGDVVPQGIMIGHTGTAGQVTGDHVHINVANGKYEGHETTSSGHKQLKNSAHVYDICYVNDTVIERGLGHNWREYTGGYVLFKKNKFKWVLFKNSSIIK